MALLNAMFKQKSNIAFNNTLFSLRTIVGMHEQMTRLYAAAAEMKQITGQSAVARLLNESPQTVKNWEGRGVSKAGAIKAQEAIGCNANWLLTGLGSMGEADDTTPKEAVQAAPVMLLRESLAAMDAAQRRRAASLFASMAEDPEGPWAAWLTDLLNVPVGGTATAQTPIGKLQLAPKIGSTAGSVNLNDTPLLSLQQQRDFEHGKTFPIPDKTAKEK